MTEVIEITVKNRIVAIRLSDRLERNPEYAKILGVSVINRKADSEKEQVHNNKENNCIKKGR